MNTLSDITINTSYLNLTDEQRHDAFDVALFAINTGELYRNTFLGITKNLYKKYLHNDYDEFQAKRAFEHTIPKIMQAYHKEIDPSVRLNAATTEIVAQELLDHYTGDFKLYPNGGLY